MSVGILFYVFTRPDVDLKQMFLTAKSLPWSYLFAAFCIYGIVLVLACQRWVILLRHFSIQVRFSLASRLMFIGLFFNNMMPSLTGGDVIKAYYTAKGTHKKMEAVTSIVLDRIFGVFGLLTLAAIGSCFALHHETLKDLARIVLLFVFLAIAGLAVFLNLHHLRRFTAIRKFSEKLYGFSFVQKLYQMLTALKGDKTSALQVFILSILMQSLLIIANFILARGLGMEGAGLAQFFVVIPIAQFISALPISFAGWGIGEGAYRSLFLILNPGFGGLAVVLSIIYRFVMLIFSLAGFPLYLMYRHGPIETELEKES